MKKKLLFTLLTVGLMSLSSCSLFNDDDIKVSNKYNPPISTVSSLDPNAIITRGVASIDNTKTPNAYCFKNIAYGTDERVTNTYKLGGINHTEYNVNNGEDYYSNKSNNNFDLYVPKTLNKTGKHTVILFIHGGAWVSGFKTDVNSYVHEFANKGYITATIKYSLLKRTMDNSSLSIFRNLDEIDACISTIKLALEELQFDTTKTNLVIGGASSGAHLAMLYSYSRGQRSALPIKFIIDAVGPVNIKPDAWKAFNDASDAVLNAGLTASAIQTQKANGNLKELEVSGEGYNWNAYQTMRIANGMCGLPYSLSDVEASTDANKQNITHPNAASNSMTKTGGGEDLLSVTYWMNGTNKFPIVCAYAGKDSVVGIAQYAALETALDSNSIQHDYVYFKNSDHIEITKEKDATAYNTFIGKTETRLAAI